ncbi:hypothetical protein Slin14017_G128500 [Septoria linicola]|nr:hypothetical protein Slin14017_G128500 [Septoria linicola]
MAEDMVALHSPTHKRVPRVLLSEHMSTSFVSEENEAAATAIDCAYCGDKSDVCTTIKRFLYDNYVALKVNHEISGYEKAACAAAIERVDIADYTGPPKDAGYYNIDEVHLQDSPPGPSRGMTSQQQHCHPARSLPLSLLPKQLYMGTANLYRLQLLQ